MNKPRTHRSWILTLLAGVSLMIFSPRVSLSQEGNEVIQVRVKNLPRPAIGFQIYPGAWVPFTDELNRYYQILPSVGLTGIMDLSNRTSLALTFGYSYAEGNFVSGGSEASTRSFLNYFWLGQDVRFVYRWMNWSRYYWGTGLRLVYMSERFQEKVGGRAKTVGHNGVGTGWGVGFGAEFFVNEWFTLGLRTDLFLIGSNNLSWEGNSYNLNNTGLWFGLTAGFYR